MTTKHSGALGLTWTNKHLRLLSHDDATYEWVEPTDFRVSEVRLLHSVTTVGDVHGDRARAKDNLLIRGDSLHALTSLLRVPEFAAEYEGKVKLVYIDPPFNTGQAFTHYDDGLEHSVWLTMLRDRLLQIKRLLADDGSVWVHLDDAEIHRARVVLDEVFGIENFVATVVWEKVYSPRMDTQQFSSSHDYIHVYSKHPGWRAGAFSVEPNPEQFPFAAADGRRYRSDPLRKWGGSSLRADRPSMWYPITTPTNQEVWPIKPDGTEGRWRWGPDKVAAHYDELDWLDKGHGLQPYVRQYADTSVSRPPETLWPHTQVGHTHEAAEELKKLLGVKFSTPKPERLLQRIIHIGTNAGDIVVDCFAGSGTTAAVAHKMRRRWVTVEWSLSTIADFALPRLKKVVSGEDDGGITLIAREESLAELPDGLSTQDVRDAVKVLRALQLSGTFSDSDTMSSNCVDEVLSLAKTAGRSRKTQQKIWNGGGGFRVLDVAPSVYEVDDATVLLAENVTAGELAESVAAQLGFAYEPDGAYCGRKNSMRLAVIDGVLSDDIVRILVGALEDKERITVVATAAEPGAEDVLRSLRPGSRVRKVPRDLARLSRRQSEVVQLVLDGLEVAE